MRLCSCCSKSIDHLWRGRKFCSRSCSTSFKNKHTHSTKGKGKGKPLCGQDGCTNHAVSYSHKFCRTCIDNKTAMKYTTNPTKQALVDMYIKKNHRSSAYSYIRWHARAVVMKNEQRICNCCGYTKHVEVCHIKSIQEFDNAATLTEINNKQNLKLLCPNCHWEFDNGLLKW